MVISSRKVFLYFISFNFYFFDMKNRNSGFYFQNKETDPNQTMKKTCVLKQLLKTSGRS